MDPQQANHDTSPKFFVTILFYPKLYSVTPLKYNNGLMDLFISFWAKILLHYYHHPFFFFFFFFWDR